MSGFQIDFRTFSGFDKDPSGRMAHALKALEALLDGQRKRETPCLSEDLPMREIRGFPWAAAVCVAVGSGLFTGKIAGQSAADATPRTSASPGSPQAPSRDDEFQRVVQPVLSRNCLSRHSDKLHTGNLSLEGLSDATLAAQKPDVWQKVLDRLTAGQMPPRPRTPLSATELADVTTWIRKLPGVSDVAASASTADPGRVTARRLNRTEYNNTIRDLLGVTLQAGRRISGRRLRLRVRQHRRRAHALADADGEVHARGAHRVEGGGLRRALPGEAACSSG